MNVHNRYELIMSITEECVSRDDLYNMLLNKKTIICYDGFEPSGKMHIAQGLMRSINTNKLTKAGCKFKFWIADWFAFMNNKFGRDMTKIRNAGKLMIEVWKACNMNMKNVEFLWSSKEIDKNPSLYWSLVLDISTKFNLNRVIKCTEIMGRKDSDNLLSSQIFYPIMQCADIFYLNVDICSLGKDQRKVNMLSREYCEKVKSKHKPVILSHLMILGLNGKGKMSKSDPDNCIYMDDTDLDVEYKILKAFCQPDSVKNNPIFQYLEFIIFPYFNELVLETHFNKKKYSCYTKLCRDYMNKEILPIDVKKMLIIYINKALTPVRAYFENNEDARTLRDLVDSYYVEKN